MSSGSKIRTSAIRPIVALPFVWLVAAFPAGPAFAKAELRTSDPAPQAVLAAAPEEVVLTFSEPIEPFYSAVSVLDGSGRRIDVGHVERDRTMATVVHVPLFGRAQGTCWVNWHVVGTDKHSSTGRFFFSAP
jgi:methionine-rich copper-binding protein CopC